MSAHRTLRKKELEQLGLRAPELREHGSPVYAEFGVTRYGCRTYRFSNE
jgi:hypothetical protein